MWYDIDHVVDASVYIKKTNTYVFRGPRLAMCIMAFRGLRASYKVEADSRGAVVARFRAHPSPRNISAGGRETPKPP